MCEKAYELGGTDFEIRIDALKLHGVCLFRLGKLIDAVAILNKANLIRQRLDDEEAERRAALQKRNDMDDLCGQYFTNRDMQAINKRRSGSFDFKRHKKMRPPKKLMTRQLSWSAHEIHQKDQAAELARYCMITVVNLDPSTSEDEHTKSADEEEGSSPTERHSSITVQG